MWRSIPKPLHVHLPPPLGGKRTSTEVIGMLEET